MPHSFLFDLSGRSRIFSFFIPVTIFYSLCFFSHNGFCSDEKFRIGFSINTLGEVNQNDAIAAVQLWTSGLANDNNIPIDPEPIIFSSIGQMQNALNDILIDCVNITTPEFVAIEKEIDTNYMIAGVKQDSIYEEYVVIVRKSSGYNSIKDLQNKSIIKLDTSRTSLAALWLETELYNKKLPSFSSFFSRTESVNNLTASVLPVFFNKSDACLVTKSGFETMVELNPQLDQQLKIILQSKPYIPMLFAFRVNYNSPFRDQVLGHLENWHNSPGGRQILTIFQTDSIIKFTYDQLRPSLELVKQYHSLH